jgi:hypothetical protein
MGKRKREREGDEKKRRKRRRAERDVAGPASTKKQTQQAKNSKSKPGKEMQAGEAKPGKKAKAGKARRQVEGRAVAEQVTLRGMSEIRRFFRTNETPVWFVSATPFNLLGIDRWVRNFSFLNYYDSFDGAHPHVFVPRHVSPPLFESIEEICNYLLAHKDVIDHVRSRGGGKALFLMFDEETERLAEEAGLEVAFPPAKLRTRLDSKIVTTQLGDEAGVPSVPNTLGRASSYDELLTLAGTRGIGTDLVVQTPYGD